MTPEEAQLRCKFFTITRQLCLPLIPSQVTAKQLEKFTEAHGNDPDFDKMLNMLKGVE